MMKSFFTFSLVAPVVLVSGFVSETTMNAQITTADSVTTPRETTEESFEVSPWNLGGVWTWTLGFDKPPYNQNNFVNYGATSNPTIKDGNYSGIMAGTDHWVDADFAVIGGGSFNSVSGQYATVRGGLRNTAKGDYSVINGGAVNKVHSNYGTILGGFRNTVKGRFGAVLGGARNTAAGRFSLAAGFLAKAMDDNSAVFNFQGDDEDCSSRGDNTVSMCASRITFGDSSAPTDLLKLLKSVSLPSKRKLKELTETDSKLEKAEKRVDDLASKVRETAGLLESLVSASR